MSVQFDEINTSPKFSGTQSDRTVTRIGHIAWSDIDAFIEELFAPGSSLPAKFPGSDILYADSYDIEPAFSDPKITNSGNGTIPNTYGKALVTVRYKNIPYQELPLGAGSETRNIFTVRVSAAGEFQTLPNTKLHWKVSGLPVKNDALSAGKVIAMETIEVTLHRVINPDFSVINYRLGTTNAEEFQNCPKNTVLFLGSDREQTVTSASEQESDGSGGNNNPWNITLKFLHREIDGEATLGWNFFFNPDTGSWEELRTDNDEPIYWETDFNAFYSL